MGDLKNPSFQKWLDDLKRKQVTARVVATRDFICRDAVHIINRSSSRSFDGRWNEESLKAALLHIMSCDSEVCKRKLREIFTR